MFTFGHVMLKMTICIWYLSETRGKTLPETDDSWMMSKNTIMQK